MFLWLPVWGGAPLGEGVAPAGAEDLGATSGSARLCSLRPGGAWRFLGAAAWLPPTLLMDTRLSWQDSSPVIWLLSRQLPSLPNLQTPGLWTAPTMTTTVSLQLV